MILQVYLEEIFFGKCCLEEWEPVAFENYMVIYEEYLLRENYNYYDISV